MFDAPCKTTGVFSSDAIPKPGLLPPESGWSPAARMRIITQTFPPIPACQPWGLTPSAKGTAWETPCSRKEPAISGSCAPRGCLGNFPTTKWWSCQWYWRNVGRGPCPPKRWSLWGYREGHRGGHPQLRGEVHQTAKGDRWTCCKKSPGLTWPNPGKIGRRAAWQSSRNATISLRGKTHNGFGGRGRGQSLGHGMPDFSAFHWKNCGRGGPKRGDRGLTVDHTKVIL